MTTKWDKRFLEMAKVVASWSKDPSTQVGAVIVRPNKTILSVGFNGFPKNLKDMPDDYFNRPQKYSKIIHAEMNALLHSPERVTGCTLYTYPLLPCDRCTVHLLQAGITSFIFPKFSELPLSVQDRWTEARQATLSYLKEAEVSWREV